MEQPFAVFIGNSMLGSHSHQSPCGARLFGIYGNFICGQTYQIKAIAFACFPFYVTYEFCISHTLNPSLNVHGPELGPILILYHKVVTCRSQCSYSESSVFKNIMLIYRDRGCLIGCICGYIVLKSNKTQLLIQRLLLGGYLRIRSR